MYYVYGLQLYVRNCIVHTAGTYTGARNMYLDYICVCCLQTVAMCVCVFKNYVCRQAKVYRVLAICRTYTHTNFFFSHVAIRNSLRSNNTPVYRDCSMPKREQRAFSVPFETWEGCGKDEREEPWDISFDSKLFAQSLSWWNRSYDLFFILPVIETHFKKESTRLK